MTAIRNNLLIINSRSTEYWQQIVTPQGIPVRRVVGATNNRGIAATFSVAQYEDMVIWLADDLTVVAQQGGNQRKVSSLALEEAIKGTDISEPYPFPERAEGYFIDDTIHKLYVLTFPEADQTWCLDMSTRLWHRRKSKNIGRWRARTSINAFGRVICGDYATGQLWRLDRNRYREGDDEQEFIIETPGIFGTQGGLFISEMELIMDVGVGSINVIEPNLTQNYNPIFIPPTKPIQRTLPIQPQLQIATSRNGGFSWSNRKTIGLGRTGERWKKVIDRSFGYVQRQQEFMIRIKITDDVPINCYSMFLDIIEGQ